MRKIVCNECGKFLFETERQSDGAAGAEAQNKGFIFKMPFLYTNTSECLFFCCCTCFKSYYDKHVPKNPEVNRIIKEMRDNIPSMTKEVCKGLQELSNEWNQLGIPKHLHGKKDGKL